MLYRVKRVDASPSARGPFTLTEPGRACAPPLALLPR